MATIVWSNFEGSQLFSLFWDITLSFRTGIYTNGSEIGDSISACNCGECRMCKIDLSYITEYNYTMNKVSNTIDTSKDEFAEMAKDFYFYLHESIKEIYGPENVIIFGRNIAIKNLWINVKEIFSLFERKVIDGYYRYDSSPVKIYSTHLPLQLDETGREKLIKFLY